MATTYLAPGVYVEEVPSAQQPIAGVGTNTVGFIGLVDKEILVPVANDYYDEYLAQTLANGPGRTPKERDAFAAAQKHLDQLMADAKAEADKTNATAARRTPVDDALKAARADLATREADLNKPPADGAQVQPSKRKQVDETLKPFRDKVKDLETQLANIDAESQITKERFLKPYRLERVAINVDVADTKLCTNFTEYTDRFGSYSAYPQPGEDDKFKGHRALTHAVAGFFKNGGTRCFVARIKDESQLQAALDQFESIDEIALIAAPGLTGKGNWKALVDHCDKADDRFAILDCDEIIEDKDGNMDIRRLQYGTDKAAELIPDRSKNAAFYFPYIQVIDPAKQLMDRDPALDVYSGYRGQLFVPPSGHVAGVYARVDEQRGVHKAPANEALNGAINVKYYVSKHHQALLNPQGVNCIRNINGSITVYGGRTVAGDANGEWKYVNVRRVMLFLKESIDEGTQWVVFEPNDPSLWAKIRLNVGAFLTRVWKSGALFGLTPQQAFYVKCDEETNPPEVRDVGQVIVEVGVAIVRPAEFVIFRITQWTGPTKS